MRLSKLFMAAALLLVSSCGYTKIDKEKDTELVNKVVKWQVDNFYNVKRSKPRSDVEWTNAALARGMIMWSDYSGNPEGENFVMQIGEKNNWGFRQREHPYHADDICIGQSYLELYKKYDRPEMIAPTIARADSMITYRSYEKHSYTNPKGKERWVWCDALFMAPPVYVELWNLTGDEKYIRFMDEEFFMTTAHLYDAGDALWFRDDRYLDQKEENGEKIFWGRGNGWVHAGLTFILTELPKDHLTYPFYQKMFVDMSEAILRCQDVNGSWHASLLDPDSYPEAENSASAFFTYSLAWGVNNGLLGKEYEKAARKGWETLKSYVQEDGKLGNIQKIAGSPGATNPNKTEVYGVGAFLMAATEMLKMAE